LVRERKDVSEMVGEFLREAGMLLGVFLPLDTVFSGKAIATRTLVLGIVTSLVFLVLGVTVERLRP
jgi:hypothetical protein